MLGSQHIYKVLHTLGIPALSRLFTAKKVAILMYHGFTENPNHTGITNHKQKHLFVEKFRKQMEYLKKHYNVISMETLAAHLGTKDPLPKNSVVITIDDGYLSNYTYAYPILKELELPATIYLATGFVNGEYYFMTDRIEYAINHADPGKYTVKSLQRSFVLEDRESRIRCVRVLSDHFKQMDQKKRSPLLKEVEKTFGLSLSKQKKIPHIYRSMKWKDVKEMQKSGLISFGGHTHSHSVLTQCKLTHAKKEIAQSKSLVEKKLKGGCTLFCYPNGGYNADVMGLVQNAGFISSPITESGFNDLYTNPFELKRFTVINDQDLPSFAMMLSGIPNVLGKVLKKIQGN